MKKYVIPPQFDYVKYQDIKPFVMYIFEFTTDLDQKDLTNIWQGITPVPALRMVKDEVVISHDINPYEFFGFTDPEVLGEVLGDMKFMVFKVKKRAKQNYYKLTEDSKDDERFNFRFQGDTIDSAIGIQGSYNWPYDFFSLVEKVNVEASYSLKVKKIDDDDEGGGA